ncbi:MAG: SURF1 family protein [Microbacteriaceae bacterium]
MARKPRWVAGLFAILALAGGFAWLAQWQIGRAVAEATVVSVDSETPVDLATLLPPMTPQKLSDGGRRVTTTGTWDTESVVVFGKSQDGVDGEWLLRNFRVNGSCLPVAVGFAEHIEPSDLIVIDDSPSTISGRLVPSDDILAGDIHTERREMIAAADLVNEWSCASIFDGYVVLDSAPQPLATIVATPPVPQAVLNWLNIFYALEWIAFALFAVYFWFRLVKDAVERETEIAAEAGK